MKNHIGKFSEMVKKSFSLLLALLMMVSVCAVSGISLNVSAATTSGQTFYLNVSQNTTWSAKATITARFADDSGTVKGTGTFQQVKPGIYSVTSPAGATKLEISASDFTQPSTVVAEGYHRIIFNASSVLNKGGSTTAYTTPYIHYYSGTTSGSVWPGVKMNVLSNGYYYFDITNDFKKCNFDNCDNGTTVTQQTDDKTMVFYGDTACFNGSQWVNPFVRTIDLTSALNGENEIYIDSTENLTLSKYAYPNHDNVDMKTVYVYNSNWANLNQVYAAYDNSDPYKTTTALSKETVDGFVMFKGEVPVGANVRVQPNSNNTNGASDVTLYPESGSYDESGYTGNTATYRISTSSEGWVKRSEINSVAYDAIVDNKFSNNENIVGVDATYYDYFSDREMTNGYLHPIQAGTGFLGSSDNWYPFYNFNNCINTIAQSNSNWAWPLYFGNFCNTSGAYSTSTHNGDYNNAKNGLARFDYAINNSNGLTDMHQAIQGLAQNKLDSNGNVMATSTLKMPYFDEEYLTTTKYNGSRIANVYKSSFPFRKSTDSSGTTTYSFDSTNATDNVYFAWDGTTPKYVNYGAGTTYGIEDGIKYFMNGETSGYGVFPFNNTSATKSMTYTNNDEKSTIYYVDVPAQYGSVIFRKLGAVNTQYPASGGYDITGVANGGSIAFDLSGNVVTLEKTADSAVASGYKRIYLQDNDVNSWSGVTIYCHGTDSDFTYNTTLDSTWKTWNNESGNTLTLLQSYQAATSSGQTYTRTGNDNLDYGFGIRLDIDFRVPANGTVNGSTSGTPVSFDYSGDDDIWVYLSDEEGNSELALDLGGDHKQAEGNINFKTMTTTVKDVYKNVGGSSTTVPNDEFWLRSDASSYYLWAWGSPTKSDSWIQLTNKITADGKSFFVADSSVFSDYTHCMFVSSNSWSGTTYSGTLKIADLLGGKWSTNGSVYSSSTTGLGEQTKTFNNGVQYDPNKTYHMTVFYMERGLIESNFKVGFTMTPANNDLKVSKSLDTSTVNQGIAEDLKANESFDYTINDGSSDTSGKAYTLNGTDKTLTNSGFSLKDTDLADFNNSFKTESNMTVNENLDSENLDYDTSWSLINNKNGATLKSGNSTNSAFTLVDPDDASAYSQLQLNYVNTPKTTNLVLGKAVVDEDGATPYTTNQQFSFQLLLDLDGESGNVYDYKGYALDYEVNGVKYKTTDDGKLTINPAHGVEISGLPVGASYKLLEEVADGYKPFSVDVNGTKTTFTGTVTGTLTAGADDSIMFTNILSPSTAALPVSKTLDGTPYSGSKFSYTLAGLGQMTTTHLDAENQPIDTLSKAGLTQTQTTADDGTVMFDGSSSDILRYPAVGFYRFKITEDFNNEKITSVEQNDYSMDESVIFVEVEVTATGGELIANTPVYYKVSSTDYSKVTINSDSDYGQFFADKYLVTGTAAFANETIKGSVTVEKVDQSNTKVQNAEFAIYKTTGNGGTVGEIVGTAKKTGADGKALFENLDIYESGYDNQSSSEPKYQWYVLKETKPAPGYTPNDTLTYFTLPAKDLDGNVLLDENNKPYYDVTYTYTDGAVVMPQASGNGVNMFLVTGVAVLGVALLLTAMYFVYDKNQRRKRRQRAKNIGK